ncbi:TetR/AcrR family transcriptional regulator [Planococcus sp. CAU13]|uniref:TetR/AcrR family transcriptional regulator n=1 Tax=Planococcus sp. CAU13 TaxID=1541197 RepID=UPI00052FE4B8|nr:TetR/AcrR family transcriptional regulator [Planococcus sp. CAU13]
MKSRILQAFIEETQENGIKFTMDDLARRIGISKRTLYEHFSSKLAILETIIDATLYDFDKRSREIIGNETITLQEKIRQTISMMPEHNDFYDERILSQLKRYYPEQWNQVTKRLNEWDELKILLEEGMKEGIIKEQNVNVLMKVIISAINTTLEQKFFSDQMTSVKQATEDITEILLHGLIIKNRNDTG